MKDFRCKFCHKLLLKYKPIDDTTIESPCGVKMSIDRKKYKITKESESFFRIKCPKCKKENDFFSIGEVMTIKQADDFLKKKLLEVSKSA